MKKQLQLILFYLILLAGCGRVKKPSSNNSSTANAVYTKDSSEIIRQLKIDLKTHSGFFSSREYSDSTKIILDTIIYSPTFRKLAVFIIAKNPTYRQLLPDTRSDWYYNANLYLAIRNSKDSILLSSTGPVLTNSIDKEELKSLMRIQYFTIFTRLKDVEGKLRYRYNLGDTQFWESSIWREIMMKESKKRMFEKKKKEHPENVYDPADNNN